MGNDQGIRRKHKQRTAPHGKHTVYPGMPIPKGVVIQGTSIKTIMDRNYAQAQPQATKAISYSDPLWINYDAAAKKLATLGGASAQALRTKQEHEFAQAYRQLVRHKLAYPIKRKYRP